MDIVLDVLRVLNFIIQWSRNKNKETMQVKNLKCKDIYTLLKAIYLISGFVFLHNSCRTGYSL